MWSTIECGRYCELRENLMNPGNPGLTGSLSFVLDGSGATNVDGHGKILKDFKEKGIVTGYPGEGTKMLSLGDENYEKAKLKLMTLNQRYKKMKNNVSYSKFFSSGGKGSTC